MRREPARSSCPGRARQRQPRQPGLAVLCPHAVSRVLTPCPQVAASTAWSAVLPPRAAVRTAQAPVRVGPVASVHQGAPTSVRGASVHQGAPAAPVHETVWAAPTRGEVPWVDQPPARGPYPGVFCPSWPFSLPSCPACQAPGPAVQEVTHRSFARRVAADRAETGRAAGRAAPVPVAADQAPVAGAVARHPVGRADGTASRQQASHR